MNTLKKLALLVLILSVNAYCTKQSKIEKILEASENIVDQYPDSVLTILESLSDIDLEKLPPHVMNKYTLLHIRAKDKCFQDVTGDTIVFSLVEYYKNNGDMLNSAMSSFYSGVVHLEREENKKAMRAYLDAEKYVAKVKGQNNLKGMIQAHIGNVFYKELLTDEAVTRFQRSINYYHLANSYSNMAISYNQIGMCYLMKEPLTYKDSALHYFQKGIDIVDKLEDKKLQAAMRLNLGLLWSETGDVDKSISYYKDALNYAEDKEIAKIYHNIAHTYLWVENMDSVQFYINMAESRFKDHPDYIMQKNINRLKSIILKDQGDYKSALALYEEFADLLQEEYNSKENEAILNIERKYNYELMKNEHNEELISNQRWIILLLILVIIVLFASVILYLKSVKNRKALKEAKDKIQVFKEMAEGYNQKNDSLRSILLQHFDILKKAALLDGYLRKEDRDNGQKVLKKFNEIIYGQERLDWNILYDAMNKLHNGFFDSVRNTFPQLDETDFRICCLIYANFSNTEIGIILGMTTSSIASRRSSLRKKMGVEEYGNIAEFIKDNIK